MQEKILFTLTTKFQKFIPTEMNPWKYPNTNWFNEVLKPWSMQHNANISMSGGTETVKTYVSLSTRYQDGFFKNSGSNYAQHDLKANIDGKINKYISLGVDFTGRMEQGDFLSVGSFYIVLRITIGKSVAPCTLAQRISGSPLRFTSAT